jgi:hypothetical protein
MSRTQMIDGSAKRLVSDLHIGDRVDLQNDMFADADAWAAFENGEDGELASQHPEFQFEFERVAWMEREAEDCVRVDFESGFSCGFPPDHLVDVDGEQDEAEGEGRSLIWIEGNEAARAGVKWWDNPHEAGSVDAYTWDQGHTHHRTGGA